MSLICKLTQMRLLCKQVQALLHWDEAAGKKAHLRNCRGRPRHLKAPFRTMLRAISPFTKSTWTAGTFATSATRLLKRCVKNKTHVSQVMPSKGGNCNSNVLLILTEQHPENSYEDSQRSEELCVRTLWQFLPHQRLLDSSQPPSLWYGKVLRGFLLKKKKKKSD